MAFKVPKIFNNEIVYYAFIFLAVLNVVGYVSSKAYECLVLFGVGYYASNTYLNNVPLSIIAGLFLSNFVFGCGRVSNSVSEGMKGVKEHLDSAMKELGQASFEGGVQAASTMEECQDANGEWDEDAKTCVNNAENFQSKIFEAMNNIEGASNVNQKVQDMFAKKKRK